MVKVAIYSIVSTNYGNRLQNYAVQKILEKNGANGVTLRRKKKNLKEKIRSWIKKDRYANFYLFNQKYITWENRYVNKDVIPKKIEEEYDCFLIGSDQIWNPTFPFSSSIDYLPFITEKKRLAYAASFGIDQIPEEHIRMVREGLEHINEISVRENSGQKIVKELTGREAQVLIDPTMMLTAEEWKKISKKPRGVDTQSGYILSYFLGTNSKKRERELEGYAEEYGLKLYRLMDPEEKKLNAAGPSEFIYLISHAKLIVTDSFHACVFSFLFGKPFLVYDREGKENNMMSRIETLLQKFDLERKYVKSGLQNQIFECDYEKGYEQLKKEKEKTMKFFQKNLRSEVE